MNELELNTFLTSDYIYIPYDNKDKINLRETGMIYKNDELAEHKSRKLYSPISGKPYGFSQINSTEGMKNILIIENDFKDKVYKKPISNKDIYEIEESKIKEITDSYATNNTLVLKISFDDNFNIKDEYLLKDNIISVLETLNLIDQTYENLKIIIRLDKRDVMTYKTLFSYMGTYPNIEIEFAKNDNQTETTVSLYDIIDIYDKIKNRNPRDYIYLSVMHDNKIEIVKTKKNSNLKDLLVHLNTMSTNIIINGKLKIQNGNFLLDESVETINIK